MRKEKDKDFEELDNKLRDNRRAMPAHQEATTCVPVNYRPHLGTPHFGVPLPLNTNISAAAFQHNKERNAVPIVYKTNTVSVTNTKKKGNLGRLYKSNKYCWNCGYQKKFHTRFQFAFGDSCCNNCGYKACSKCGWRISDFHRDGLFGPFCTREGTQKGCDDWYKPAPASNG